MYKKIFIIFFLLTAANTIASEDDPILRYAPNLEEILRVQNDPFIKEQVHFYPFAVDRDNDEYSYLIEPHKENGLVVGYDFFFSKAQYARDAELVGDLVKIHALKRPCEIRQKTGRIIKPQLTPVSKEIIYDEDVKEWYKPLFQVIFAKNFELYGNK